MKHRNLLVLAFLIPLLFTSCLADYLNKKFEFDKPVSITYHTRVGLGPASKKVFPGTALTSEDLPVVTPDDNEQYYTFTGWYTDESCLNPVKEGFIVNEDITIYAGWDYNPQYTTCYSVHFYLFDPDYYYDGFKLHTEYSKTFDSEQEAAACNIYIDGYDYIPGADEYHYSSYSGENQYTTDINKYYYKNQISASQFSTITSYLPNYADSGFNYNFYITDYAPDLSYFSYSSGPYSIIHLENCLGISDIPAYAFYNCYWLTEIYFPASINTIGAFAFCNCYSLRDFSLPYGLEKIEDYAFSSCETLTLISLPDSITELGQEVFSNCTSIHHVSLSVNLSKIPSNIFYNCINLANIYIPSQVTTIAEYSFYNCYSLEHIYLPISCTLIQPDAFYNCTSLKFIYYEGNETDKANIALKDDRLSSDDVQWEWNSY